MSLDDLPLGRLGRRLDTSPSIWAGPSPSEARRQARTQPSPRAPKPAPPVNLTATLRAEIDACGAAVMVGLCDVVDTDGDDYLLDPPAPWTGRLRLLYAVDPNPGPDGRNHRVLLMVRADNARTCQEAAAATFGIHPADYSPTREV